MRKKKKTHQPPPSQTGSEAFGQDPDGAPTGSEAFGEGESPPKREIAVEDEVVTTPLPTFHDQRWSTQLRAVFVEPQRPRRRNRCRFDGLKDLELGATVGVEQPTEGISSHDQWLRPTFRFVSEAEIEDPILSGKSGGDPGDRTYCESGRLRDPAGQEADE